MAPVDIIFYILNFFSTILLTILALMDGVRSNIIAQLEKDILPLQGLKSLSTDNNINIGFRAIEHAFPNAIFPIGCIT